MWGSVLCVLKSMIDCCLTSKSTDLYINNIWMKECRFLLREITIIQRKKQMLLVTNIVFSSCRLWYNCLFSQVQVHFFLSHLIIGFVLFFFLMNLFVLRLVMNLVMCKEAAMRNIQHVFIALCDLGVLFLFFFLSRESRKAVNFILRHCTVDQSCKYFTSTKKPNKQYVL